MMTNWSMLCASIEHITRNNTQFSEMVLDSWERPSLKDKTKECVSIAGYVISIIKNRRPVRAAGF